MLCGLTAALPMARADSIADKQRQAQQITDEIERLGERAADLGETWNGAQIQLQQAQADVKDAQDKLTALESKLGTVRNTASEFAVRAYIYADQSSGIASLLSGTSVTGGSAQRVGYETVALGNTAQVTDGMRALIQDADAQHAVLQARQQRQAQLVKNVAAAKGAAEKAQGEQQQALVKVKGELATLVQQEQQRRAAEAARQSQLAAQQARAALLAAQQRPTTPIATPTPTAVLPGASVAATTTTAFGKKATMTNPPPAVNVPATSPGAAIAVRAALSQLGVPYRFAAASPGVAFDCSGLTMWAWSQAGVSLPHFAASQYGTLPHIPMSQLQPGDLVFFYSDIHHVGMYIGNGQYVQAPRTGDVVKISPLAGRSIVGAARP
jgi:cell wall-associated NlpC family hydrolase